MPSLSTDSSNPTVSIILPTYNRERFLPQALASICAQELTDWELIVIDDGSKDQTREVITKLARDIPQPLRYIYQENQGAYGARNTGLDAVRGRYVAFFDSDDLWLPHHLKNCVEVLQTNQDVHWVYGAGRNVDMATGRILAPHSFYIEGRPRPFLQLGGRRQDKLHVLEDPGTARCTILFGLYCGLQNSVFCREVFSQLRFHSKDRNEAEDQVFVVRALKAGYRLAYLNDVHMIYHVHDENSSASCLDASLEKRATIFRCLIRGYEDLRTQVQLTPAESRALNLRLSREYFWHLGYAIYWQHGRRQEALDAFRRGLRLRPWEWRYWKTYLGAMIQNKFSHARVGCTGLEK
jgi:glycosyltransferase involved in cell wall biosynthesis